jgi:hypothetical protein
MRDIHGTTGRGLATTTFLVRLQRFPFHDLSLADGLPPRQRNSAPYACRMGFREERVARNEVAARKINEAIEEGDTRPANSFIHVFCECGLQDCERVMAITRPVYERVRSDPRQFVIVPSHLIAEVEDVVQDGHGFLIVAKRGGTPEDIAVRTDPRR